MSILTDDPLTQLAFSVYENKGVFALLVGSGLSRAAEVPTGWEITLDLVRRVAIAQSIEPQPDWAEWHRKTTGVEPNYSALLKELASSPDERRSILHSYIEPDEEDREAGRKLPTAAHYAIADLVRGGYIRVIITTNFDRLIENALRERGVEPTVVASVDALSGAEPITHSACYVLKLHGDYKDARILNTEAELNKYPTKYTRLLDRIFDEHGLVICGWSGEWDHALRAAMLRAPNRRYPVFWAARGGKVRGAAEEVVKQRRAQVISITDAQRFLPDLQRRVETLEQSRRHNPLSIDLLIESAKRFLAKTEYRIQLEELLTAETERLLTQLDAPEFSPQGQWGPAEFQSRVKRYEAVSEALARVSGVLGRWGGGDELELVEDIVKSLYAHSEKPMGGTTAYINLRSYPALLVFTAYSLGATRSKRWADLHALFVSTIHREYKEAKRAIDLLFLWGWKGAESSVWKLLEGHKDKKTPESDYLCTLFSEWGKSFVGLSADFEMLFERFETLASLAHLESKAKADVSTDLANPQGWVWMPVGRSGWHSKTRDVLLAEIKSDAMRVPLLKAGFALGDAEFLDLFITNFSRISSQQFWR